MKQKNDNYPQFWFGFALGGAVCGLAAVAMGTKQGRTILRQNQTKTEDNYHFFVSFLLL
jgi:hypothetical protein